MPIFEFRCLKCGSLFEKLFINSGEELDIRCPDCKSTSFERVISRTSHVIGTGKGAGKPKITSKSCSSGNNCITMDIPGPGK